MSDKKLSFIPVYGTKEKVEAQERKAGYIYFTTDSGEIFLDTEASRVKVGSSSAGASLFYSEQATSEENPIPEVEDREGYYLLTASEVLLGDAKIKEDDLIIGTDGAFYRYVASDENGDFICLRMAISGSGGGGEVITVKDLDVVIDSNTLQAYSTLVYGQDYYVEVTATSDTDRYVSLSFEFTGANGYEYAFSERATSGVVHRVNLNFLPINNSIKMVVTAHADNSQMVKAPSKSVSNIKVVDMHIDKQSGANYLPVQSGELQLRYIPYGKGLSPKLHISVDGNEIEHSVKLIDDNMGAAQTVAIPKQPHGTHTIAL